MSQINKPAYEVAAALGATSPDRIPSAPHRAWSMVFDFGSIASTGSQVVTVRNDQGRLFVPEEFVGCVYYAAAAAPIVAGTALAGYGDPSPPATVGNTLAPATLVDVEFGTDAGPWTSGPVAWPNLIGSAAQPFVPRFIWCAAAGANVRCTIINNTAVAIAGQIVLHGRQIAI